MTENNDPHKSLLYRTSTKKKIKTEIISATGFNHKEEGKKTQSRYEVIEKLES